MCWTFTTFFGNSFTDFLLIEFGRFQKISISNAYCAILTLQIICASYFIGNMLYSWMRRVCKTTPLSLGRNGGGGRQNIHIGMGKVQRWRGREGRGMGGREACQNLTDL